MIHRLVFAALLFSLPTLVNAQPSKSLQKVLELEIPREGGANGASVTWHPVQKKYYAAMAGNEDFCMGIFDASGKRQSDIDQKTYFDVRGLWYNPDTKTLQTNGYKDYGWAEYKLNSKGFPTGINILHKGLNQPDDQSVGAYNTKDKGVYFFNTDGSIEKYDMESASFVEIVELFLGSTKESDIEAADNYEVIDDYNTSVVCTGITGAEIGLYNVSENRIELYNIKTGYMTRVLTLPSGTPMEFFLNFSYCNGVYWLFDKKLRTWKGYK